MVIGIVGGIASGKSLVADCLRKLGAAVVDADAAGHQVLREPAVIEALRRRWGDEILDSQGQVRRSVVARIVFEPGPTGPEELAFLERTTHPRITKRLQEELHRLGRQDGRRAIVLDAPVLFKAGWDRFCDKIIFVAAPRELRLGRARSRGWSQTEFDAREAAQESLNEKRDRADWVIDNSGSPEHTVAQVERWWQSLD